MESFETYRTYLFAIAYRMLGSAMDAEDIVQETYLRYQSPPKDPIRSLKGYLTTILTRLCIDQLQLARRKRELYVGPWLPEPILTAETPEATDPEKRVELEESISLARVKRPVAAPSAGRSCICARIDHASRPRAKHTGSCSADMSRRLSVVR